MQEFMLGPWRIDPLGRKVAHTQDLARPKVRLSNKANLVLMALAEAEGRVVTRQELLDTVWYGVVVGDEVLTHAIAELRRALGDVPKTPQFIETVPKTGYRLMKPAVAGEAADAAPPAAVVREPQEIGPKEVGGEAEESVGERPSIAVLPFVNVSGDPAQSYFSDGISEDIIIELVRFRTLAVAASSSAFAYRDLDRDLRAVGRDLGVDYILEGSVRKLGGRVRITVHLVDTKTGSHVWTERYDRSLSEIFDIQDEITATIVGTLSGEIASASLERARRQPHCSWRAYDLYLMARRYSQLPRTIENVEQAYHFAERATEADPQFALGHSLLSSAIRWRAVLTSLGDTPTVRNAFERCHRTALKAVELNSSEAQTLGALGWSHMVRRNYDEAERWLGRAYTLNPHDLDLAMRWVTALSYLGRPREAIALAERTMERAPSYPDYCLFDLGEAHFFAGDYDRAIELFERTPEEELDESRVTVIAAFALGGAMDRATRHAERYCHDLQEKWRGDQGVLLAERIAWEFEFRHVHRRPEDTARLKLALRKVGLPVVGVGLDKLAEFNSTLSPAALLPGGESPVPVRQDRNVHPIRGAKTAG